MIKRTNCFWIAGLVSLCFLAKTDKTQAQITSDGTLSTQVQTTNNLDFTITNGNRVGNNLFHSFREFSVPTQGAASFSNEPDVQNIISRVTGSSISNIDGLLKTNSSANLFLINPNGIIFGPNASLNINGSFVTSTASHLLFGDGTQFSATNPQTPPLLTVSVPIGLQFGQTTKPIQVEGSKLRVSSAKTLAMLGGDVLIKGGELTAREGRIELGSVTGGSLVNLTPIAEGWALGYADVANFRDIRVSQAAVINTTGEGNGAIQLHGREIAITGGSAAGGVTQGAEPGQPLVIKASESVEVSSSSLILTSQLATFTVGTGAASDISIETKRLIVEAGVIETSTLSSGSGGNLTVDASKSVELVGGSDFSSLNVRSLSDQKDGGNAGTMRISTRKLILRDGGQISTSTISSGSGGTLRVDASESVEASGRIVVNTVDFPSGLLAETRKAGFIAATGQGGDLIVNTQRLVVQGGASISVASLSGSTGQAGKLDINAPGSVTVSGTGINRNGQIVPSSLLATSESSGSAGDLRINTGKLTVRDGAAVSVSSIGSGTAGNLEITAGNLLLNNKGTITAESTGGQGNINLRSNGLILRRGSNITTNAKGSNVIGGNININTGVLAAFENSDISANSAGFRGGQVRIKTQSLFGTQFRNAPTLESDITATGASPELSGTVNINTFNIDLLRGLINLPVEPNEPRLAQGCNTDAPQNQSEFIITGRGGLPPNPREVLRSNRVYVDWVTLDTDAENRVRSDESGEGQRQTSRRTNPQDAKSAHPVENEIVEAQGWVVDKKGDVILVANVPTATPHSPAINPTSCSTSAN